MSLAMIACYLTSFENRHFREVSFYEAFIWVSPFFNGIWHDPGAHFPKEFSMGQHRHFSDDCRVQYVLPMRFYAFSSGRITGKQKNVAGHRGKLARAVDDDARVFIPVRL